MAREMKDSGVEWIGEIPIDWQLVPLKRFATVNNGQEIQCEVDADTPGAVGVYGSGGIFKYTTTAQYDGVAVLFGRKGTLGRPLFVQGKFWAVDTMYYLTYHEQLLEKYSYYQLCAFDWTPHITQTAIPSIVASEIVACPFPIPPNDKQKIISEFLDCKCTKIDAVLDKTRASIEEYKKLKQAIITQTVTKGVRGDKPMKESGIKWMPMVPDDWLVCKTLYCLNMPITDGPHITPELYDEGIPFVSAEAVSCGNGVIDFSHIRGYVSSEFYADCCKKYVPEIDDIYMIKSGATTGKVAIVDTDRIFTIWSPLAVFRCNRSITFPKYMFYFLQSIPYQKQIELGWSYGTQQNIGMRTLERLKVCLPPLDEQREIVEYLNDKISKIDLFIKKKEKMLSELESYKKSLIYEYVTGKKEAPHVTPTD